MRASRFMLGPLLVSLSHTAAAAETTLQLSGDVPSAGPDHFFVAFDVPAGTKEIEIKHDDLSSEDILDFGVNDPDGFRGWGGGNTEPAVIGEQAASRSYVAGPIAAGTWQVVIGKALIKSTPAKYQLDITLRDTATLPPQTERTAYVAAAPLEVGARWYAGDFHVHSIESGDARPPLDELATFARGRGLDFVLVSDHNTLTQLEFFVDAQSRHPKLLLLPGMEYTTYDGHANAIGATQWVDHKIGQPSVNIEGAVQAFRDQGAIVSINHPTQDLGDLCIGCAWAHDLDPKLIGAVEVMTGTPATIDYLPKVKAIDYWEKLLDQGYHLPAIGGSDDHRAGVDLNALQSPIGDCTTMVFATELSQQGILDGVRSGRTVVKLWGPDEPMVELTSSVTLQGDTVSATSTVFSAKISGGLGKSVRFVKNGKPLGQEAVASDPFTHTLEATAPASGEDRYRVEVVDGEDRRTLTSYLWLKAPALQDAGVDATTSDAGSPAAPAPRAAGGGCDCRSRPGSRSSGGLGLSMALLLLVARRHRRRRGQPDV